MFRPQDFCSLEREKRLLFVESGSGSDPAPLDDADDVVIPTTPTTPAPSPDGSDGAPERTLHTPGNLAEHAIAAFAEEAEVTASERTREEIITQVNESTFQEVGKMEANVEKRKKLGFMGKVLTMTVATRKTDEELLSLTFDEIAKKAVDKRNESMMKSHNKALHRIAESTRQTGSEFIFLEQKLKQLRSYINAYQKMLVVYTEQRARFESLISTLREGDNQVFAAEIGKIEEMIDQLETLYKEEEEKATQTSERERVDEIQKRDNELRKLLTEENAEFFSTKNLTQLILEAVGGNPLPLKEAIMDGVKDDAKREVFLAAADDLTMDLPAASMKGRAYSHLSKWWKYRKDPEGRKKEEEHQRALAYNYSTQVLEAEKDLDVPDLDRRLANLDKLPVGSRVAIAAVDGKMYFFTSAGKQAVGSSGKEFNILRTHDGRYAAVSPKDKKIWYQYDRNSQSHPFRLKLPDENRMPAKKDPTILYLQAH